MDTAFKSKPMECSHLYYTCNFLNFMHGVDTYTVWFVDEESAHYATSYRLFGASESGSRALDMSMHKQGENFTFFVLVSLNDLCYVEAELAQTDGTAFINFIHRACTAFNNHSQHIVPPDTNRLSIYSRLCCAKNFQAILTRFRHLSLFPCEI